MNIIEYTETYNKLQYLQTFKHFLQAVFLQPF